MRKWILTGTTLKTPFHIALFRMKLRGQIFAMSEIRTDWNVFVNSVIFSNVLLLWFPCGQGLKKLILVLFLKLDKPLYDSQ